MSDWRIYPVTARLEKKTEKMSGSPKFSWLVVGVLEYVGEAEHGFTEEEIGCDQEKLAEILHDFLLYMEGRE